MTKPAAKRRQKKLTVWLRGKDLYGEIVLTGNRKVWISMEAGSEELTPTAARQLASTITRLANLADVRRGRPNVVGETTKAWEIELRKGRTIFVSKKEDHSCGAYQPLVHGVRAPWTCDLLKGHTGEHVGFFFDTLNGRPSEVAHRWTRKRKRRKSKLGKKRAA